MHKFKVKLNVRAFVCNFYSEQRTIVNLLKRIFLFRIQHCFTISYRRDNQRQYDLKAANESECATWIIAIREARYKISDFELENIYHPLSFSSFNKLLLQKEELEQKHVHLLQVVESEKTAKWQYTQQCEELASEIKKLRAEVNI